MATNSPEYMRDWHRKGAKTYFEYVALLQEAG